MTFRECMKDALIKAIGSRADYDILIAAGDWVKTGHFIEQDVLDIKAIIDERRNVNLMEESVEELIEGEV